MTEAQVRQRVVGVMQGWVGRKEADGSHRAIIDIYNNHKPLARGYKVTYADPWCAATVSAAAIYVGMTNIIPTECSCSAMIELFKRLGRWQEDDAYVPQPADVIFYDWQDGPNFAVTDNVGAPDHVGYVEKVVGNTITVIEGNISDSVGRRTIAVNGRYIRGYGLPDYASLADMTVWNAIDKLAKLGVINSPDYWEQAVVSGKVEHLDTLLVKAAAKISKAGTRTSTAENGIGALVGAGVIDTPNYWLDAYHTFPNLDALLCALGGAVR